MSGARARVAVAAGNTLGEGIVWCPRRRRLFWTDIQAATLWSHDPARGLSRTWAVPERLATLALCRDPDWLLLGLASRLAFFHLPSGRLREVCEVEPDLPTRLNDGACDREGRFVFGTLHEPPDGTPAQPVGGFYRLDADLSLHRLALGGVAISNSLAFSPDGRTLYFCDSPTRVIRRCAYHEDGSVGAAEDWVDLGGIDGEPDGSAVDADGGLWNAQWGMGRVVRYTPEGREDVVVSVPASQVSRPAFGGEDLDTLFVTSAHDGMPVPRRRRHLASGHVFCCQGGHRGLPEPCFAGLPADASSA